MNVVRTSALFVLFLVFVAPSVGVAQSKHVVQEYLYAGNLDQGKEVLEKAIRDEPNNDQLRFELGVLMFLQGVEELGQSLFECAPADGLFGGQIPFIRLPVPENENPKAVELKDIRKIIQDFNVSLGHTERFLAKVKSEDVRLPLKPFVIRLDFDGDNQITEFDDLAPVLMQYMGGRRRQAPEELRQAVIVFDRADVDWLRGYCCLLRAMCETTLAYDQTLLWDSVAHRIFTRGIVAHDFLREEEPNEGFFSPRYISDIIAGIHNCRFQLKEPKRLKIAHQHLLDTIGHSRNMWKRIKAETDNEGEWIPSPEQENPFTQVRVTRQMTETWDTFLDEAEQILKGEKLIPFWRGKNPKRGVNLRKIFHEPTDIDVVLWIHGSEMIPFLEMGNCSSPDTWRQFQRVFRGNFFGFALWFN